METRSTEQVTYRLDGHIGKIGDIQRGAMHGEKAADGGMSGHVADDW